MRMPALKLLSSQHSLSEGVTPRADNDAALLNAYSHTVSSVAERVSPSVVKISILRKNRRDAVLGTGSGFFISPEGYVVTNAHVVAVQGDIEVRTLDGGRYLATIQGNDPHTDLAVLKINGFGFRHSISNDRGLEKVRWIFSQCRPSLAFFSDLSNVINVAKCANRADCYRGLWTTLDAAPQCPARRSRSDAKAKAGYQ